MNLIKQALTASIETAPVDWNFDLSYSPESISDYLELQDVISVSDRERDELLDSDLEVSQEDAIGEFARLTMVRLKATFGLLNGHIKRAEKLKASLKDKSPVNANVESELRFLLPPKAKANDLMKQLTTVEELKNGLVEYVNVSGKVMKSLTADSGIKDGTHGWWSAGILLPVVGEFIGDVRVVTQNNGHISEKKVDKMTAKIHAHFREVGSIGVVKLFKDKITIHDGDIIDGAWINRNTVFGTVDVAAWGNDGIAIPGVTKAKGYKDEGTYQFDGLTSEDAITMIDSIINTQTELSKLQETIKVVTQGVKSTGWEYAQTTFIGYLLRVMSTRFRRKGNVGVNLLKIESHSVGSAFKFMDAYGKNADKIISMIEKSFK